jgi:hypothetical protein
MHSKSATRNTKINLWILDINLKNKTKEEQDLIIIITKKKQEEEWRRGEVSWG